MDTQNFISNFQEAFGEAELPIMFGYSNEAKGNIAKTQGCLFKAFKDIRNGTPVSLSAQTLGCGGGKFYSGFTPMPEYVPVFVSEKEHYKQSPEMVRDYVARLGVERTDKEYMWFARIDKAETISEEETEGIIFLAVPDVLSGLLTWAFFDNNSPETVSLPFGSGCSSIITQTVNENRRNGRRTFLGFFDPSVRPYFEENILAFAMPMSRFREMCGTMRDSCLFDTHAWKKLRERIVSSQR